MDIYAEDDVEDNDKKDIGAEMTKMDVLMKKMTELKEELKKMKRKVSKSDRKDKERHRIQNFEEELWFDI